MYAESDLHLVTPAVFVSTIEVVCLIWSQDPLENLFAGKVFYNSCYIHISSSEIPKKIIRTT